MITCFPSLSQRIGVTDDVGNRSPVTVSDRLTEVAFEVVEGRHLRIAVNVELVAKDDVLCDGELAAQTDRKVCHVQQTGSDRIRQLRDELHRTYECAASRSRSGRTCLLNTGCTST